MLIRVLNNVFFRLLYFSKELQFSTTLPIQLPAKLYLDYLSAICLLIQFLLYNCRPFPHAACW